MSAAKKDQLVYTEPERCRVCYTCVRECPAKAIRIYNGQAEVIGDRCIACGNCIRVCSQGAKVFRKSTDVVKKILGTEKKIAAIIAPSFPAEFQNLPNYHTFVGMVKALGFTYVNEVAFGADLVARQYKDIIESPDLHRYISSDCPAIVSFIEKYHPNLIKQLATIVSPMVATTRVLRKLHGENLKVVFIGPCIAKKDESEEVDVAITFRELRKLWNEKRITPEKITPIEFDPPLSGKGAIFPVSRGLLQTVDIEDSIDKGNIIVAEGRENFQEAIREFESGLISSQHLELLCCDGCIMGAGMTNDGNRFAKMTFISKYVRSKLNKLDKERWDAEVKKYADLDLSREHQANDQRVEMPSANQIDEVLQKIGKFDPLDHLNCGACGYDTCEEHAIAIIKGLAETEMCLPYTIEKLHESIESLNISNDKLASAQQALRQSEKLASMGQLSAGIAHELNNPLGVVIMYANILLDECSDDSQMREDLKLIVEQADRCKSIVGGLLNFARKNQLHTEEIDLEKLALQSISSIIVPDNVKTKVISNLTLKKELLDAEQMMQVLTNMNKNAIEAMPNGGNLTVTISENDKEIIYEISDTGIGIAPENIDNVFEPFFTTKGIGKGTGLGLATTYGIIKMHKGKIEIDSNHDPEKGATGTTFKITIPRTHPVS